MNRSDWQQWRDDVLTDPVEIGGEVGVLGLRWAPELGVKKVVIYDGNGLALAVLNPETESALRWIPGEWGHCESLSFYFVMLYSSTRGVLLRRALV